MSGNTFGKIFKVTTFGESHGEALGVIIDGLPAGTKISLEKIQSALDRRRPGAGVNGIKSASVTSRNEPDTAQILSGVFEGKAEGTPVSIVIYNQNQKSKDYGNLSDRDTQILHISKNTVFAITGEAVVQVEGKPLQELPRVLSLLNFLKILE